MTRSQFLRGNWTDNSTESHPPWALPAAAFAKSCNGCGDCVVACAENILKMSSRNLAIVDFSNGRCTFCGSCVSTCKTGALQAGETGDTRPWRIHAEISGHCLAEQGISCVLCCERCEQDAIRSWPALRGRSRMETDKDSCTGCGACIAPCPVNAISMQSPSAVTWSGQAFLRSAQ